MKSFILAFLNYSDKLSTRIVTFNWRKDEILNTLELPGGLDNKQFRLYVLRTINAVKKNLALSSTENEIADLLKVHPDLSKDVRGNQDLLKREFADNEFNPFLHLAAHLEIRRQLEMDKPKGVRRLREQLLEQGFDELTAEEILCDALTQISLFEMEGDEMDGDIYLIKLENMISDLSHPPEVEEEPLVCYNDENVEYEAKMTAMEQAGFITPRMFDYIQSRLIQDWYEEASTKPIKLNTTLKAALNKLPAQWVEATAMFFKRPRQRTNRDRVADLCSFLTTEENLHYIVAQLDDEETEALCLILRDDGWVKYGKLSKEFGDESEDDYWWLDDPPESVIGRLRLKGLVMVGKAPLGSRRYKVAVLPVELRDGLKSMLMLE